VNVKLYVIEVGIRAAVTWWRIRRRARHVRSEVDLLAALRQGQVFWW
jgi:hypothetical protein